MHALSKMALAIALAAGASLAAAQDGTHDAHAAHAAQSASATVELTDGEVRKIDKEAGKITLRHGELKNLNMSAMTMVFRVKDPAMLDQVKVGDTVRFAAERVDGAITVVQLQPVR